MAARRRRFQFCIERPQSIRRLFLQLRNFVVVAARQPESRTVSRAPPYHILWVRGCRGHTISRPGFNLFKPLRRHFPATPFCRQPLAPRSRRPKRLSSKIDRLGDLRRDGGAGTNVEQPRHSGKKFVERLASYRTKRLRTLPSTASRSGASPPRLPPKINKPFQKRDTLPPGRRAAVLGASFPEIYARRTGTRASRTTAAASSASASPGRFNS
jgi:hypothetical protein